ncbi:MAG: multidrug transporter, partial [Rhodobacteraceae bacterium]|nr:multidrug transporter [Paracoccaceae bacterium]
MALTAMANRDNPSLGIFMMLVTYFLFSLVDTSVKWLLYAGLGSFQ